MEELFGFDSLSTGSFVASLPQASLTNAELGGVGPTVATAETLGMDPSWSPSSSWTPAPLTYKEPPNSVFTPAPINGVSQPETVVQYGGANRYTGRWDQLSGSTGAIAPSVTKMPARDTTLADVQSMDALQQAVWFRDNNFDPVAQARILGENKKEPSSPWVSPQMIMNYGFIGTSILSIFLGYERDKEAQKAQERALDPLRQAQRDITYNNAMSDAGFDRFGNPKDDGGSSGSSSGGGGAVDISNATNPFLS